MMKRAVHHTSRSPDRIRRNRLLPAIAVGSLLLLLLPLSVTAQDRSADDGEEPEARANLTGEVVSAMTGGPLENAQVMVKSTGQATLTGERGQFALSDIPAGHQTIEVSLIGFAEEEVSLNLRAGATTSVTFLLSETVLRLEDIRVEVERPERGGKMAGFEDRMRRGMGAFVTLEDIQRRDPRVPSDMLRTVTGVRVGGSAVARFPEIQMSRARPDCPPALWVDGIRRPGMHIDEINRDDLLAMEVYRGPAETPPQFAYREATCGTIVVWTREGRDEF